MSVRATCSNCGKTVKGGDDWAGRSASCPGCNAPIRFASAAPPAPPPLPQADPKPGPEPAWTPNPSGVFVAPVESRPVMPHVDYHKVLRTAADHWRYIAVAIAALILGYFAGREHLKYEIKSAFSGFGAAMKEGIDRSFGGMAANDDHEPDPEAAKIIIQGSSYLRANTGFMRRSMIELRVCNTGSRAARRVYFHGKLQSPGRTLPWAEDDFNYEIPGGLEPGEVQTWQLSPGLASEFYNQEKPNDSTFVVTVKDVEWAE